MEIAILVIAQVCAAVSDTGGLQIIVTADASGAAAGRETVTGQ